MPLWLIFIVVGVLFAVLGLGGIGQWMITVGVIVLVVGVVLTFIRRRSRV